MNNSHLIQMSHQTMTSSSTVADGRLQSQNMRSALKQGKNREVESLDPPSQQPRSRRQAYFQPQQLPSFNHFLSPVQLPYWGNRNDVGYQTGFQDPAFTHQAMEDRDWPNDPLQWTSPKTPQNLDSTSSLSSFSCKLSAMSSQPSVPDLFRDTPSLPCWDPQLEMTEPLEPSKDEIIARLREAIIAERKTVDTFFNYAVKRLGIDQDRLGTIHVNNQASQPNSLWLA
jgi:hypothetical protein